MNPDLLNHQFEMRLRGMAWRGMAWRGMTTNLDIWSSQMTDALTDGLDNMTHLGVR